MLKVKPLFVFVKREYLNSQGSYLALNDMGIISLQVEKGLSKKDIENKWFIVNENSQGSETVEGPFNDYLQMMEHYTKNLGDYLLMLDNCDD